MNRLGLLDFKKGIVLLLMVTVLASCKKLNDDDVLVVIDAIANFSFSQEKSTVTFTNKSTGWDECLWSFDGHGTSTEEHPIVVFTDGGKFNVNLTVSNQFGSSKHQATVTIVKTLSIPPIVLTVEDEFWDRKTVLTRELDRATFGGKYYYEISENADFSTKPDLQINKGSSQVTFTWDYEVSPFSPVTFLGLRPSTTYYVRGKMEWQLPEQVEVLRTEAVSFTTTALPVPNLEWDQHLYRINTTVTTGLGNFDINNLIDHQTSFFKDPGLTQAYWPGNFTPGSFSFDKELGETLYFVHKMVYKKYPEIQRSTVLPIHVPYKFISLYFLKEEYTYTKYADGFRIELESEKGHHLLMNFVNRIEGSDTYEIEVNYEDDSQNYISFYNPYSKDTAFAYANQGYILKESAHTKNLNYHIYSFNELVLFPLDRDRATSVGNIYFRLDD